MWMKLHSDTSISKRDEIERTLFQLMLDQVPEYIPNGCSNVYAPLIMDLSWKPSDFHTAVTPSWSYFRMSLADRSPEG